MRSILNNCINFAQKHWPGACLLCGHDCGDALCADCREALPRLPVARCGQCALPIPSGERCASCLKRPPAFDAVYCGYRLAHPLHDLIAGFKRPNRWHLASALAPLMQETAPTLPADACLIPMPLGPVRLTERGFNQAGELGRRLATARQLEWQTGWLQRLRDGDDQRGLDRAARRRNVRGAFAASPAVSGRTVVLVDDVLTTGATLDEAARTLKAAGATAVYGWILARAL